MKAKFQVSDKVIFDNQYSMKYKKGDIVKFTKERIKKAYEREPVKRDTTWDKWDKFVVENHNTPLTITYVQLHKGNIDPIPLVCVDGIRGYWNEESFEYYNNFNEDLFAL